MRVFIPVDHMPENAAVARNESFHSSQVVMFVELTPSGMHAGELELAK